MVWKLHTAALSNPEKQLYADTDTAHSDTLITRVKAAKRSVMQQNDAQFFVILF